MPASETVALDFHVPEDDYAWGLVGFEFVDQPHQVSFGKRIPIEACRELPQFECLKGAHCYSLNSKVCVCLGNL